MLHEVPEILEDFILEPAGGDFFLKSDDFVHHQYQMVLTKDRPQFFKERGLKCCPRVSEKEGTVRNSHTELMVALQTAAYRIRNSQQKITHAVQAETMEVDKNAPVVRIKMTVQLVQDGCLPCSPLPV